MHERCAEVLFRRSHDAKGLGYLLMNRGVNRMNEGPWDAALADCDEASRMLEGAGYLIDAAIADMNAGVVLVRQGRTAEMLRRSVAIERTFRGLGWEEGIAYLDIGIAAAHGQRRELSEALTRLAHAEQVFMETHNVEFLGETRRQRALCQLYHGHHEEALTDLTAIDPAWFEADPVLEVSVSWLGGHAALQRGELARADVLLHRAADLAEARRLPFERARVAWSLEGWAEVASSDEGPRWREVRLDTFRKLDVTDALPALPIH